MIEQVESLKQLTIEALFEGIFSELVSCKLSPNGSKKSRENDGLQSLAEKKIKLKHQSVACTKSSSSESSCPPLPLYPSSHREDLVGEIRAKLGEYLVSSYSKVRHRLVQRFLISVTGVE